MTVIPLWLFLLGVWLIPTVVSLLWLRVRAEADNPVELDQDDELPYAVALLWPVFLVLAAVVVPFWCIFVGLPRLIVRVQRWNKARLRSVPAPVSASQPDLGPHRTPRCGACGKEVSP